MAEQVVLLVEDSETDVKLVQRAFRVHGLPGKLIVATDGNLAKMAVDRMPDDHQVPDLVLLDLKLPIANGVEVLQHLRKSKATETVPVVMLTSSDEPEDIKRCYFEGANAYVRKVENYEEYMGMMYNIGRFWLQTNLPCPNG